MAWKIKGKRTCICSKERVFFFFFFFFLAAEIIPKELRSRLEVISEESGYPSFLTASRWPEIMRGYNRYVQLSWHR